MYNRIITILTAVLNIAAASLTAAGSYPIVDTGQDRCYNTSTEIACPASGAMFYGQDSQYDGAQPSYTLSADGLTVYDNNTGLTWTKTPDLNGDGNIDNSDKLTQSQAEAYAATLNASRFGGYSDWRLPSIKELYSLMDFRGTDPFMEGTDTSSLVPYIDTTYFEFGYGDLNAGDRIIDAQFASTTIYAGTVMNGSTAMFGLNLADGRIKGYGLNSGGSSEKTFYALYCRGNTDYGENQFANNGDGTISDTATGLTWQQADSGYGMNWEDALAYAEGLVLGGHDDWRLPNAKELQSIVDYTRSPDTTSSAAIDPLFSATEIVNEAGNTDYAFYWTGTTHIQQGGSAARAAYIAFGRGLGSMDNVNVIDVHGAGCQRSDPKDGNPSDYPTWGGGSQGDVRRVFNCVRCVRDGVVTAADTDGDGVSDADETEAGTALDDKADFPIVQGRHATASDRRPILLWNADGAATWYQVWLNRNGEEYFSTWLQQTETSWTPSMDLDCGSYTWWVQPWGRRLGGLGTWAGPYELDIDCGISPADGETVAAGRPEFQWNNSPGATWYWIWVERDGNNLFSTWLQQSEGSWTSNRDLGSGSYTWWFKPWSPIMGYGSWSSAASFQVN